MFFVESLEPSWLASRGERLAYFLGSRIAAAVAFALGAGLLLPYGVQADYGNSLIFEALFLGTAVYAGVAYGLAWMIRLERALQRGVGPPRAANYLYLGAGFAVYAAGLAFGAVFVPEQFATEARTAMLFGLVYNGLLFGWLQVGQAGADPLDEIRFAASFAWSPFAVRFLIGLAPLAALTPWFWSRTLEETQYVALLLTAVWTMPWISAAVGKGHQRGVVHHGRGERGGVGLHLANSLRSAALAGAILGLPALLATSLWRPWDLHLGFYLAQAALLTTVVFLGVGGYDVLQHATLRAILALRGHLPWRLREFLETSAQLGFLRRSGQGYRFRGRTLQEYFMHRAPAESAFPNVSQEFN